MSYVWIVLWLVFAAAVCGYLGWSVNITLAQRKAWSEFAAKYKLTVVRSRAPLQPWSMNGMIQGRHLDVYVQQEQADMERVIRVYTHIEVSLNTPPPFALLLSKKELPMVLGSHSDAKRFTFSGPDWPSLAFASASDNEAMTVWLTPQRLRALKAFMDSAGKGEEAIVMGDGQRTLLLWRTEDPLRDPRSLNALVQKLFGFAKDLDSAVAGLSENPKPSSDTPSNVAG